MNKISFRLLAAAVALCAHGVFAASEGDMAPTDKASNQLYWQGQAALKKSDWNTALKRFAELEKLLREKEPQSADAALYWEAYALVQANRSTDAARVFARIGTTVTAWPWALDGDPVEQFSHWVARSDR